MFTSSPKAEALDAAFNALAHPARRSILSRLATHGESTITELSAPFDMSQPAVSHHIKVLERAGLITRRIDGTSRPCRLSDRGVHTIDRWLSLLREAATANYARLDALLDESGPTEEDPHR